MAGSGGFRPSLVSSGTAIGPQASVLASEHGMSKRAGITLDSTKVDADAAGNKVVAVGTILILDATTGKYEPYTPGETIADAVKDSTGILVDASINLRHGDVITGLLLHGSVLVARIPNVDAGARAAIGSRIIFQ